MGGITDIFGGGGSGNAGGSAGINNINTSSPAFNLNSNQSGGNITTNITPTNTPFQLANESTFDRLINQDLPFLRSQTAPNASQFRQAALGQISNSERKNRSNLINQAELRSTRGSSFHNDDLSRAAAEFGQKKAQTEAAVSAQELKQTQGLLAFEQSAIFAQLNNEFRLIGLAEDQSKALANLTVQAQISNDLAAQQQQQGKGSLFGTLFGEGLNAFGAGGAFGGSKGGGGNLDAQADADIGTFGDSPNFEGIF